MGQKITIDSATLMNKGLEVIEAHWLFGLPASQIDVVVHPQSIVHSMVELMDGSVIAQMGITDMRLAHPIRVLVPDRWDAPVPFLDLTRMGALTFEEPAWDDFRCLGLAYRALDADRSLPIVLNAANEVAVASFLQGALRVYGDSGADCPDHGRPRGRPGGDVGPRSGASMPGPGCAPRPACGSHNRCRRDIARDHASGVCVCARRCSCSCTSSAISWRPAGTASAC